MALRTIAHRGRSWSVHAAAEGGSVTGWQLLFGFRPEGAARSERTLWVKHPFTAPNKSSVFAHADLVTAADLAAMLDGVLPREGG